MNHQESTPEHRLNQLNKQYRASIVNGYKHDELRSLKEAIEKVKVEIERKVRR